MESPKFFAGYKIKKEINPRKKKRQLVKLEHFLLIDVKSNEKTVILTFSNENYAKYLKKINLEEINKL